jgi:hypothetical protein
MPVSPPACANTSAVIFAVSATVPAIFASSSATFGFIVDTTELLLESSSLISGILFNNFSNSSANPLLFPSIPTKLIYALIFTLSPSSLAAS